MWERGIRRDKGVRKGCWESQDGKPALYGGQQLAPDTRPLCVEAKRNFSPLYNLKSDCSVVSTPRVSASWGGESCPPGLDPPLLQDTQGTNRSPKSEHHQLS